MLPRVASDNRRGRALEKIEKEKKRREELAQRKKDREQQKAIHEYKIEEENKARVAKEMDDKYRSSIQRGGAEGGRVWQLQDKRESREGLAQQYEPIFDKFKMQVDQEAQEYLSKESAKELARQPIFKSFLAGSQQEVSPRDMRTLTQILDASATGVDRSTPIEPSGNDSSVKESGTKKQMGVRIPVDVKAMKVPRTKVVRSNSRTSRLTLEQRLAFEKESRRRVIEAVWSSPPKNYYRKLSTKLRLAPFDILPLLALNPVNPVPFNLPQPESSTDEEEEAKDRGSGDSSDGEGEGGGESNHPLDNSGGASSCKSHRRHQRRKRRKPKPNSIIAQAQDKFGRNGGVVLNIPPTIATIPSEMLYEAVGDFNDFNRKAEDGDFEDMSVEDVQLLLFTSSDGHVVARRLKGEDWQKRLARKWTRLAMKRKSLLEEAHGRASRVRAAARTKAERVRNKQAARDGAEALNFEAQMAALVAQRSPKRGKRAQSRNSRRNRAPSESHAATSPTYAKQRAKLIAMEKKQAALRNANRLDDIVIAAAVKRIPSKTNPERRKTNIVLANHGGVEQVLSRISSGEKSVVQRFVYSRSQRHSTYRVTWRRGGKDGHSSYQASGWNISNNCIYGDAAGVIDAEKRIKERALIASRKENEAATCIQKSARGRMVRTRFERFKRDGDNSSDRNAANINSNPSAGRAKAEKSKIAHQRHLRQLASEYSFCCSPSDRNNRPDTIPAELLKCTQIGGQSIAKPAAALDRIRKHLEELLQNHPHYRCRVAFEEITGDFILGVSADQTEDETWTCVGIKSFRIFESSIVPVAHQKKLTAEDIEQAEAEGDPEEALLSSPMMLHLRGTQKDLFLEPTEAELAEARKCHGKIVMPKSQTDMKAGGAGGNFLRRACCCCGLELGLKQAASLQVSKGPDPVCKVTFSMVENTVNVLCRAELCDKNAACFSAFRTLQKQPKWHVPEKRYECLPVCQLCHELCAAASKLRDIGAKFPLATHVVRPNDREDDAPHYLSEFAMSKDEHYEKLGRFKRSSEQQGKNITSSASMISLKGGTQAARQKRDEQTRKDKNDGMSTSMPVVVNKTKLRGKIRQVRHTQLDPRYVPRGTLQEMGEREACSC